MTLTQHPRLSRRALLALLGASVAACSPRGVTSAEPTVTPSPTETDDRSSPSPTPTQQTLDPLPPYETVEGETYPNAKRLAGRFVQALATYDEDATARAVLREAARGAAAEGFDFDAALEQSRLLFERQGRSRGEIVYPQLGGLALGSGLDRCSVMVVVRQEIVDADGDSHTVTRTVDVRLINRDDQWELESLPDAGGTPVKRPKKLPRAAQRVLDNPRIQLPESARWDIHSGIIDRRLLRTMHRIADVAPYAVCTLRTGHPIHVFGTDRVSGHTAGRAVDIWEVGGRPVVLQQPAEDTDAYEFTQTLLLDHGVPELGSPWDLDGPPVAGQARPSFTDAVHADHIHVAFRAV